MLLNYTYVAIHIILGKLKMALFFSYLQYNMFHHMSNNLKLFYLWPKPALLFNILIHVHPHMPHSHL